MSSPNMAKQTAQKALIPQVEDLAIPKPPDTIRDRLDRLLSMQSTAIDHINSIRSSVNGDNNIPDTAININTFNLEELVHALIERQVIINDMLNSIDREI